MNEALKMLLSLSLSGGLLIGLLELTRPLYEQRLGKQWQYYIYLLVILRLLVPWTPEAGLVGALFAEKTPVIVQTEVHLPPEDSIQAFPEEGASAAVEALTMAASPVDQAPLQVSVLSFLRQYWWLLWLLAALILLVRKLTVYQSFVQYIRAGSEPVADIQLLEHFGRLVDELGVRQGVELAVNPLISSPLVMGLIHPVVVLPASPGNEAYFRYIILHELTHLRRRDMLYKWLVQLVVCLHWFNPLVYLMSRQLNRLCELSCDCAVLARLAEPEYRAYGDTLLSATRFGGSYHNNLASLTLNESKALLKERLDAIMAYPKQSKRRLIMTAAATITLMLCATAIGAYAAPMKAPVGQDNSVLLPADTETLSLDLDIQNGGVIILPANDKAITASYDKQYYDVLITQKDGRQLVLVRGKIAEMGRTDHVRLYVPEVKRAIAVKVRNGDFTYDLAAGRADTLQIDAADSGLAITSPDHYASCAVNLTADNADYLGYELIACPDYFTKKDQTISYTGSAAASTVDIRLTGYTSVDLMDDAQALHLLTSADGDLYTSGDGVYYLFLAGATPANRPTSSVTAGYISLVLVEKDGYTTLGPFAPSDHLAADIIAQSAAMQKDNHLSTDKAALISQRAALIAEAAHLSAWPAPAYTPDEAGLITIPVSIDTLRGGSELSLGEIPDITALTSVHYALNIGSQDGRICVGLRQPQNNDVRFFSIEKKLRPLDHTVQMEMVKDESWGFLNKELAKHYSGPYQVTIQSLEGDLSNISGTLTVQYSTAK